MLQPKFYCENCKKEVSAKDKICPRCGKFFSDVRCPKCNFTGKSELFFAGCPQCGYLNPALREVPAGAAGDIEILDPKAFEVGRSASEKGKTLPPWFFFAVTLGLAFLLAVFVYLYITL